MSYCIVACVQVERERYALQALAGTGAPYLPRMLFPPCTLVASDMPCAQVCLGSPALVTTRLGVPLHTRLAWHCGLRMRSAQLKLLAVSLAAATHCLTVRGWVVTLLDGHDSP